LNGKVHDPVHDSRASAENRFNDFLRSGAHREAISTAIAFDITSVRDYYGRVSRAYDVIERVDDPVLKRDLVLFAQQELLAAGNHRAAAGLAAVYKYVIASDEQKDAWANENAQRKFRAVERNEILFAMRREEMNNGLRHGELKLTMAEILRVVKRDRTKALHPSDRPAWDVRGEPAPKPPISKAIFGLDLAALRDGGHLTKEGRRYMLTR
jgi:hypothetical protein